MRILTFRWGTVQNPGILFVNVYLPVHTATVSVAEIEQLDSLVSDLRSQFPADTVIMGGDFNYDPWRAAAQQAQGISRPPLIR